MILDELGVWCIVSPEALDSPWASSTHLDVFLDRGIKVLEALECERRDLGVTWAAGRQAFAHKVTGLIVDKLWHRKTSAASHS